MKFLEIFNIKELIFLFQIIYSSQKNNTPQYLPALEYSLPAFKIMMKH